MRPCAAGDAPDAVSNPHGFKPKPARERKARQELQDKAESGLIASNYRFGPTLGTGARIGAPLQRACACMCVGRSRAGAPALVAAATRRVRTRVCARRAHGRRPGAWPQARTRW